MMLGTSCDKIMKMENIPCSAICQLKVLKGYIVEGYLMPQKTHMLIYLISGSLSMGSSMTSPALQKDSNNCVLFPVPVTSNAIHAQPITVNPSSTGHVIIQYTGNGTLQCQQQEIVFGKSGEECDVWASGCDWLKLMTNESNCYIKCGCSNSPCHYSVIVADMAYSTQWSFCSVELG